MLGECPLEITDMLSNCLKDTLFHLQQFFELELDLLVGYRLVSVVETGLLGHLHHLWTHASVNSQRIVVLVRIEPIYKLLIRLNFIILEQLTRHNIRLRLQRVLLYLFLRINSSCILSIGRR